MGRGELGVSAVGQILTGAVVELDNPKTWIAGVLAGLSGLFAWSARRNLAQLDKGNETRDEAHKELSARVRILESNMATRADIDRLDRRLNDMGDTMNEQHGRILEALVRSRGGA